MVKLRYLFNKYTSIYSLPFRITLVYFLIGAIWILFSDRVLFLFVKSSYTLNLLSTFKGWFFIIVTSIILYIFSFHSHKDIQKSRIESREKDRRLGAIFSAANTISFIITSFKNGESIIEEFSPGAELIFGYKSNEVIGENVTILYTQGNKRNYDDMINQISNHQSIDYEINMARKSGEEFPASLTIYPLFDDGDNLVGALGVTFDITNYKRTEEQLKETSTLLKTTFDNIPDAIGVQDMDHRIVQYNKAGCDFFDKRINDILGKKCYELLGHNEPCEKCATLLTCETRKPSKIERYEKELGLWLDIRSYPILNEDGEIIKIIEHMRDITERKKSEELLRESIEINKKLLDEIVEYDKIKTEFFSNISHELRTPLTVIYSALQLVDKYHKDGKMVTEADNITKHITTMKQNSFRLLRLINNLIDLTRIDSGFYKMKLENHNIVNIIEEITMSVADYIEDKTIKLQFDTDIEEKIMAVDADKIERIMLNLLSNATKFTEPGGRIWVNLFDKGENVVVTIRDSGVGIPEDKLDVIFERFRQVDSSLTRSHEGSGIGLSLVRSFVEMHGGSIIVESKLDEGSQFIMELPVVILPESESGIVIPKTKNNYVDMINIEFSDIYFGNIA